MTARAGQTGKDGRKGGRRFWRNASGASALEFALVAFPFILLVLAVLEVGIVYFANFMLENAVAQGARLIRTGQAQNQNFDAGKFKTEVCKNLSAPIDCSRLMLDVRHFSSFSNAGSDLTNPLDSQRQPQDEFQLRPRRGRRRGGGPRLL